jgi:NADPH-dependent 2,4-dienoyl-CoA reductase/sulfur reductase-like enzyme
MTDKDSKHFKYAIVGGGLAAGYAAQVFAEAGIPAGQLAIFSAENIPPYERPPLSKAFLRGDEKAEKLWINPPEFYAEHGLELFLETPITHLDLQQRLLRAEDRSFGFDQLLLATGSKVNKFDLPGADLEGLHYLRERSDSRSIREAAQKAKTAVVIGGGFIGMEVSAVLRQLGLEVTLIFPEERVWEAVFTPPISEFFTKYYRERGVEFQTGIEIQRFEGDGDGHLTRVVLGDGSRLLADLVVAGIGVRPVLALYEDTGLILNKGVEVNRFLTTNFPDVYAVGDIALYYDVLFEKQRRLEHWSNAKKQGQHAARMMLGERAVYEEIPYFFSDVFDLSYEFWGDTADADEVIYRGEMEEASFSAWWLQNGRVLAAFILDRPEEERELAQEWIRTQALVEANVLRSSGPLTPVMDENSTPG